MGVGGREGALVCKSRDCSPEVVGQQGGRRLGQVVVRWDRGWVVVRRPRSVDTRSGADRSNRLRLEEVPLRRRNAFERHTRGQLRRERQRW